MQIRTEDSDLSFSQQNSEYFSLTVHIPVFGVNPQKTIKASQVYERNIY